MCLMSSMQPRASGYPGPESYPVKHILPFNWRKILSRYCLFKKGFQMKTFFLPQQN
jgi:hypothetical protein